MNTVFDALTLDSGTNKAFIYKRIQEIPSISQTCTVVSVGLKAVSELANAYGAQEVQEIAREAFSMLIGKYSIEAKYSVTDQAVAFVFERAFSKDELMRIQRDLKQIDGALRFPLLNFWGVAVQGKSTFALSEASNFAIQQYENSDCVGFDLLDESSVHILSSHSKTVESIINTTTADHYSELYVQPQLCVSTGEVRGYEVLSRWRSEDTGIFVRTPELIKRLIAHGLIEEYDVSVVQRVLENMPYDYQAQRDLPCSINLSAHTLVSRKAMQKLVKLISVPDVKAKAQLITFEITGSDQIKSNSVFKAGVRELRKLGVKIAIDDFGASNSSISQILDCEFDEIKLDQWFIRSCQSEKGITLFKSVLALAKIQASRIVVEGIETKNELDFIREADPDILVQGYYCEKPLPIKELGGLLAGSFAA